MWQNILIGVAIYCVVMIPVLLVVARAMAFGMGTDEERAREEKDLN